MIPAELTAEPTIKLFPRKPEPIVDHRPFAGSEHTLRESFAVLLTRSLAQFLLGVQYSEACVSSAVSAVCDFTTTKFNMVVEERDGSYTVDSSTSAYLARGAQRSYDLALEEEEARVVSQRLSEVVNYMSQAVQINSRASEFGAGDPNCF